jgi:hypothetical protein
MNLSFINKAVHKKAAVTLHFCIKEQWENYKLHRNPDTQSVQLMNMLVGPQRNHLWLQARLTALQQDGVNAGCIIPYIQLQGRL